MPNQIIQEAAQKMQAAFQHLQEEFSQLHTGRANAGLVEGIMVEVFGSTMPIKALASIAVPEANQITIQPWNRDQLASIEKAIKNSHLSLNPNNDGILIRLILPPLTEERRKELVKLVSKYAEDGRVSVRNARHDALKKLTAMEKNKEISEDELAGKEKALQKEVDEFNGKIEEYSRNKEKDIMTI